jgi:hypothetical protein
MDLPQKTCDVVRPVVWEHDQEEAYSYEDHPGQFHSHKVGTVQYHI